MARLGLYKIGRIDTVPRLFGPDTFDQLLSDFLIGSVTAQQRPRIPFFDGEQAIAKFDLPPLGAIGCRYCKTVAKQG